MLLREYAYCLAAGRTRKAHGLCVVSSTLFCFNVIQLRCTFRSAPLYFMDHIYLSQEVCRLSKVKAQQQQQQLHYWQSDDVAEGCGRYGSALCFLIAVAIAGEPEWRDAGTWRAPPNHTPVRWTRISLFTYESVPKKKLKKNCFCHTTRKKVGEPSDANVPTPRLFSTLSPTMIIIMGSSRWKVAVAVLFAAGCLLVCVDADEHEHTVRRV